MERILIDAFGNNSWIGGLYYKYNIIYSLLQNEYIVDHCELFVMVDSSSQKLFERRCYLNQCEYNVAPRLPI